jgi:hypothetical protein
MKASSDQVTDDFLSSVRRIEGPETDAAQTREGSQRGVSGTCSASKDCLAGGGIGAKLLRVQPERYLSQDAESASAPGKQCAKRGAEFCSYKAGWR